MDTLMTSLSSTLKERVNCKMRFFGELNVVEWFASLKMHTLTCYKLTFPLVLYKNNELNKRFTQITKEPAKEQLTRKTSVTIKMSAKSSSGHKGKVEVHPSEPDIEK